MTQETENGHPRVVSGINAAIEFAAKDQLAAAIKLLTTLAEEFPKASAVHGYLAWYLLEDGRHREAIQRSGIAVRLSPESEIASLVHFHALWKAGEHTDALDEMKRFLSIRPSDEYANILKGWE